MADICLEKTRQRRKFTETQTTTSILETDKLLILKTALLIGEGEERRCYLHPTDQNKVVKVPHEHSGNNSQNNFEQQTYLYLKKHHDQLDFISHCYGFSDTDLGPGLLCQCVRDYTGNISKSILDTIVEGPECSHRQLKATVAAFCNRLVAENIQLFDLNPKNIVLRLDQPKQYSAVSIDLKGRYAIKEFIPFSNFIPFLSRRKLKRRGERLLRKMDYIRDNVALFK